jgi:hypothetical protein
MNVSLGLMDYFPLPAMPFDTHKNVIFESGKSDTVEVTQKAEHKKSDKYRHETAYAYHPQNHNRFTTQGQHVDFVIA